MSNSLTSEILLKLRKVVAPWLDNSVQNVMIIGSELTEEFAKFIYPV